MKLSEEQERKLALAQEIIGYEFHDKSFLLSAITHPSAVEGLPRRYSYERLEFLGDSVLGAIVAAEAFNAYHDLDEGGLTRIKVALVSGASLSDVSAQLGFADVIVFGSSEAGTGRRGLHSALENVYEAIVAALFLDGGTLTARQFVMRTLIPRMNADMAKEPENPKSALQEKLQEDGITPTYKLVETQGPPHDRTFVAQVFAGSQGLAQGTGRTKKEAESQAAKSTLARLGEFIDLITNADPEKRAAAKRAKEEKAAAAKRAKEEKAAAAQLAKEEKAAAAQKAKEAKAAAAQRAKEEKARRKAEGSGGVLAWLLDTQEYQETPQVAELPAPDGSYELPDEAYDSADEEFFLSEEGSAYLEDLAMSAQDAEHVIDAETVSDGETSEMSEEIAADANNEISEAEGFAKDIDNEEPAR